MDSITHAPNHTPCCPQTLCTCGPCTPNKGLIGWWGSPGPSPPQPDANPGPANGRQVSDSFRCSTCRGQEPCLMIASCPAVPCWGPRFCVCFKLPLSSSCSPPCLLLLSLFAAFWTQEPPLRLGEVSPLPFIRACLVLLSQTRGPEWRGLGPLHSLPVLGVGLPFHPKCLSGVGVGALLGLR